MSEFIPTSNQPSDTLAAVDLGSNSFHMIIARVSNGQIKVIDRLREMVRLGEGLTADKRLRPEIADRALACLERFGQRVRPMPQGSVRAVGTNTLRQLGDNTEFILRAQQSLGHPIEVIGGREEARLIYLGVAHGLAAGDEKRLVVDIGGGSTELIVGQGFTPTLRESLHMGCVSMSRDQFSDGRIEAKAMERAQLTGAVEIRPVRKMFRGAGWQTAVGSSGTIKAIRDVVTAEGWSKDGITAESLERLSKVLTDFGQVEGIKLKGLSDERRPVFAGGVAVLASVFQNLGIERMQVSDQALREGLLYELIGSSQHFDVQERTIDGLAHHFQVDTDQARRVETTALYLYGQVVQAWDLGVSQYQSMLSWAARLHEIGLHVAHNQYHKHGAYLIRNSDLSGFSYREQAVLSALVRGHRRKYPLGECNALPVEVQQCTRRLCVLLRLAVLVHRGRSTMSKPMPIIQVKDERIFLSFPHNWLAVHPLTRAELEQEAVRLGDVGFHLELVP